ncbi:MAG: tetratricopeptide repeat protein [Pyrinomonadaceae bacterium]
MTEHLILIDEAQENLLSCATFLAENIKSSDGRGTAMKEIVPRYLEKGEVDMAAQLADLVDDPFVRDRLLSDVADKCAEIDDDEYALQLVESIEDLSLQAEAKERIAIRKAYIGEFDKAFEITALLDHPSHALGIIAYRQTVKGLETEARQTLSLIEYPASKVNALQFIAEHYEKENKIEQANNALDEAVKAAEETDLAEETARILQYVAEHFRANDRNDKAIETFEKAKLIAEKVEGVHRDDLLAGISIGQLRAGSVDLADRTLDLVNDPVQTATCLVGFSRVFWEKGEREDALESLEEAYALVKSQRDRDIRDSRAHFAVWGTIAVQFAKFEKQERAIEIAQENISESERTSALAQIAQVSTLQNEDEFARQALKAIPDEALRMFALIGVSDAKKRLGDEEKAIGVLDEAAALCETIPQLTARSTAYNELATRFHDYGKTEKTRELLHENLETIAKIRDESARAISLAQLSDVYERANFTLSDAEKEIIKTMLRHAER